MAWFKKQNIVIKVIVGIIALGFICCVCGIPIAIISPDPTPTVERVARTEDISTLESASNKPTETPVSVDTLSPTDTTKSILFFAEIIQHPDEKGWTSTQYNTYFDTIKGEYVSGWSGTILEIDEWGGSPYLSLDVKPGEPKIDAYVYINKDDVLKVRIGQSVTIDGIIDDRWPESNGFYALQVKDVTLLELGEIPTQTPVSTNTPEPTVTPIPEIGRPIVSASENNINIRSGPGTDYDVIGTLLTDESLEIIGRNADSSWWQVSTPNDAGWIFANVVTASNIDDRIPVVEIPPVPISTVPPPTQKPATELPPVEPVATEPPQVEACDCSGNHYNCGDFGTHTSAQVCYEYCKSIGYGDVHGLDRDDDGTACDPTGWD